MKNFFTLLLLFSSFFGFSQAILFSDDFGTSSQNPLVRSGYSTVSTGSPWELRTTSQSSGYTGSSGGANVFTNLGTDNNEKSITYSSISTIGYTTIKVKVGAVKSGTVPNLDVRYQINGAGFISAGTLTLPTTWGLFTISLPSSTNNVSQLDIQFAINANSNSSNNFRLDDFSVTADVTLPVSLTKFNAFFQNRQVNLNWSIANASNFDRFEVEHSTNGVDFTTLQSISTRKTMDYATTDANPSKGINYYRLKMMDLDGRFSYSEVKTVKVASETVWSVSPTKSSSLLTATVNENEESTIQLFNTNGQLVYNTIQNGNPKVEIPVGNLTSGIYIVRISVSGSVVYSERIIKE